MSDNTNYIMWDYKQYKRIINSIFDYNTLYELYTNNKILVVLEDNNHILSIKKRCVMSLQINNEPRQDYTIGMKDPLSNKIIVLSQSKTIQTYSKLSIKYMKEKIIKQYEILLAQNNNYNRNI